MEPQSLRELLKTYDLLFPEEAQTSEAFLRFLERSPHGFERTSLEGHVTGSAWLVSPDEEFVLLTHHKKLNKWLQLGGHAEGETNVLSVALREAYEESGIQDLEVLSPEIFDVDIHQIPPQPNEPSHAHYDCCFLLKAHQWTFQTSDESHALEWVPINQIIRYSQEFSILRMQRKWINRSVHKNEVKSL